MHDIQLPVCLAQKNLLARKMPVLWKHCKVHNWFGNIDVKGFLQRIGGAKLVITDSFHGIVFCMLYNKPFISIPGANALRYERIANLLQETGLSYRTVRTLEYYESKKDQLFTSVDWQPIMELFEKRRAEFKDFIRCNIV